MNNIRASISKGRDRYFWFWVLVIVAGVIGFRYHQYVIAENYLLHVTTPCDTEAHSCFVYVDTESGASSENTAFKKIEILASQAPSCLEEHTCGEFSCTNYAGCNEIYCDEDTLSDGESCVSGVTNQQI